MNQLSDWRAPEHWGRITTVDMHTGGEPLRVVVDGLPPIEGRTVLEADDSTKNYRPKNLILRDWI
jgi:proline racemase